MGRKRTWQSRGEHWLSTVYLFHPFWLQNTGRAYGAGAGRHSHGLKALRSNEFLQPNLLGWKSSTLSLTSFSVTATPWHKSLLWDFLAVLRGTPSGLTQVGAQWKRCWATHEVFWKSHSFCDTHLSLFPFQESRNFTSYFLEALWR